MFDKPDMEWQKRNRERIREGLARAMQTFALGVESEGVGQHYLKAADRAMEVLLPPVPNPFPGFLEQLARDSDTHPKDGDAKQGSARE